jgi:inositol 2-dehydrogenase
LNASGPEFGFVRTPSRRRRKRSGGDTIIVVRNELKVGLAGVGRMGRVYAQNLAQRVPNARLTAVADHHPDLVKSVAEEFGIPRVYTSHEELVADRNIDAIVIVTSTSTHKDVIIAAAAAGKAIFCEKPLALSLTDAEEALRAVERAGVFFQMAFQRRFDSGYRGARKKIEEGAIGDPVVITSTSRDPFRPPLEYCDPKASGGLIADMGVHDFDIARMFMGEVKTVYATGGALAYPEMKTVGDIDNAIVNLAFDSGKLGVVHLSRNAVFGYDIRAEVWGTKGSIQIGYFRETPILVMTEQGVTHDVVPYFMQRFEGAYLAQIRDFVDNVLAGGKPSITGADAIAAMRISIAATRSLVEGRPVDTREADFGQRASAASEKPIA